MVSMQRDKSVSFGNGFLDLDSPTDTPVLIGTSDVNDLFSNNMSLYRDDVPPSRPQLSGVKRGGGIVPPKSCLPCL